MGEPYIDSTTQEEHDRNMAHDFPYRADVCDMHAFPLDTYPWHWHNEVEFFFMQEGSLRYHIPGEQIEFAQGDAGFINANVMHSTQATCAGPCLQQEHIFLPALVGGSGASRLDTAFVRPLCSDGSLRAVRFAHGTPQCREATDLMRRAFSLFAQKPFGHELRIRACMAELWLLVLQGKPGCAQGTAAATADEERLKKMLTYIQEHYAERITLSQIAAAASVGERECCRCFSRQIHTSPVSYVTEFRINRACAMLRSGNDKIEAIAERCGFTDASYFGKMFKKRMGVPPQAWRMAPPG